MNYEYKVQIGTKGKDDWIMSTYSFKNEINAKVWAKRCKEMRPNAKTRIVRRPKDWEVVE